MSRRHHKKSQAAAFMPKPGGKKELERQCRERAAKQRLRLHKFCAVMLLLFDKWLHNEYILDDIEGLPANERRFIKMQRSKCLLRTQAAVRLLNEKEHYAPGGSAFFRDASNEAVALMKKVCDAPSMPETCRYMDVHAAVTYVMYAALRDWEAMEVMGGKEDSLCRCPEVMDMISAIGIFCDHLVPLGSFLAQPINDVYWSTRDGLHAGAPLPDWFGTMKEEGKAS